MPKKKEKIRLSLDLNNDAYEALDHLAAEMGGTKSDVLRRAIALMEVVIQAKKEGKKLGLAEKRSDLVTEIIGI